MSAAALNQLIAWETFCVLGIDQVDNSSMPSGDVTPADCPQGGLRDQVPASFPGHPIFAAKAAETTWDCLLEDRDC